MRAGICINGAQNDFRSAVGNDELSAQPFDPVGIIQQIQRHVHFAIAAHPDFIIKSAIRVQIQRGHIIAIVLCPRLPPSFRNVVFDADLRVNRRHPDGNIRGVVREYRRLPIGRFLIIAAARNFKAHRARFRFAVADVGLQIADFPFVAQPGGAHVYAAFDLQRPPVVRGGGKRRFALEIALRCAHSIPSSIRCGQQIRIAGFDRASVPAGFLTRRIRNPNAVAHPHIVPENARPALILNPIADCAEDFGREPLLRVDIFNAKLFNAVDGFRPLGGMRLRKARIVPFEKFYRTVAFEHPTDRQLFSVVIGLLQRKRRRSVGKLHRLTGILPVRHAVQLFIIGLRAARVALGLHSGKGRLK